MAKFNIQIPMTQTEVYYTRVFIYRLLGEKCNILSQTKNV